MNERLDLIENWQFKINSNLSNKNEFKEWRNAAVPGTVHTDLLNHKLIDEPFYDDNESQLNWICENDWIYKTKFDKPKEFGKKLSQFLIFEGLDTVSEIYFNKKLLGKSDNMFLKYEFEISSLIKDKNNELEVRFKSPINYAKSLENKYGKLSVALDSGRVYIRKAQYSFGWDWGPSFPTMGIWRPVYLLQKSKVSIKSFNFTTKKITAKKAIVEVKINLNQKPKRKYKIRASLTCNDQIFEGEKVLDSNKEVRLKLKIEDPKLWWPNNEGKQNLYDLNITLFDESENKLDEKIKKVGIRTISLQLKNNSDSTFRFIINDKPVFAKGVNWIPADSFLPRVTKEKYETLLKYAKDAHMNIVRVWGGGFYEDDIFYGLCDELGLLVWQDFMFACAAYPEHKDFLKNVKSEVTQNVDRLQAHPSIALWCGNNENEWLWYQGQKKSYKLMPGYKIYHDLIPNIIKEIDPDRAYWPSSPFSFDKDPNSHSSGNRHEWGIWSMWKDYETVKDDQSLFVTEFGFQGPANKKTFEKYLSEENRNINNPIFEFHNKQIEGPERVIKFLSSHLPIKTEWDDFIYLAQLNQGFALKTCLEHWRQNWPVTNGSIVWQINDCWPVTSWAIIDSESTPKIAYHFVKNIFNQQIASIIKDDNDLKIQIVNNSSDNFKFKLKADIYDNSGSSINEITINDHITGDTKKVFKKIPINSLTENKNWNIILSLYDQDNQLIFRNFYTEEKWKFKSLPLTGIKIELQEKSLKLVTDKPAYFVDLYHPELEFSERGFILLPGEEKVLQIIGSNQSITKNDIKIFTLNNYLSN